MFARVFGLCAVFVAVVAFVSAPSAAIAKVRTGATVDVSTRAAVVNYLRSINIDPRGVVIERGLRNYAGANCPGPGWTCTTTTHPVVQVAAPGGSNTFHCSTASCAVVQVASQRAATNTATCIRKSGFAQKCTISQTSSTARNKAVVYERISKSGGLSQSASSKVTIRQKATGPAAVANSNEACVYQAIALNQSVKSGRNFVTGIQSAHQTVTIRQDSKYGGNSAGEIATPHGHCASGPITQLQTLKSKLTVPRSVHQKQNAASHGANVTIDIEQNQSAGFLGTAHGVNSAKFSQYNTLTAVANAAHGPVVQWQSSVHGGLLGTINQDSRDVSTAVTSQTEIQCEDAATAGLLTCDTSDPDAATAPPSLAQTQIGPVHKGVGTATQTGNASDTFSISQSSQQDDDQGAGSHQTNNLTGDCLTAGNCTLFQLVDINGQESSSFQSGSNLNHAIDCKGTSCSGGGSPSRRR